MRTHQGKDERQGNHMDYTMTIVMLVLMCGTLIYVLITNSNRRKSCTARLPPGPNHFQIISSIIKLGPQPHKLVANLSETYGPLMSLKLGGMPFIVTSSPQVAKELIRKEDQSFSNRRVPDASHAHDHSSHSIFWLPVGNKWKNLRKISKEHMFAAHKLDASQVHRTKAVEQLLDYVRECCVSGEAVDIGMVTFTTSLNMLSNFFFSTDFGSYYSNNSSEEFKDLVADVVDILGKPNLVDYFPTLKLVDPQGIRRQAKLTFDKYLGVFERIISHRLEARGSSPNTRSTGNDILDSLLDVCEIQKNDWELSSVWLKHFLADLFVAGTDTNSSTVEWAMVELLRNPEKMAKARSELLEVIGKDGQVQESDISRLPYLQAVVKETLRLHPPTPLVFRRKCEAEVEVQGFVVPKNAQVMFNLWASGRDSNVWLNADCFTPERFLDGSIIDYRGQHCELIPFGTGKRICPGFPLAHKMMHLMLGSLLYSFDWKLQGDMKPEDIDLSEKFGLALRKAVTQKAIPCIDISV